MNQTLWETRLVSARWLTAGFFDEAFFRLSLLYNLSTNIHGPSSLSSTSIHIHIPFHATFLCPLRVFHPAHKELEMDSWRVVVLGDGGVGKTALAVQVCPQLIPRSPTMILTPHQFTLNCFVGQLIFL